MQYGYAITTMKKNDKRTTVRMNRLISKPEKDIHVDHIDGNKLNNKRKNLRHATPSQNHMNKRKVVGSSVFKGVFYDKTRKLWRAQVMKDGKHVFSKRFKSEIEAAKAYDVAAIKYFGEFACTNKDLGLF